MNSTPYEGPYSVNEQELQEVLDLLNHVFRQTDGDMGKDYPRHVGKNNLENIRIIREGGKVMSHVATSVRPVTLAGIATKVAGIGAVATHEDGRGKGFASILMKDAVERSIEQGADIMLISGDKGIYRRMNAVECGRYPVLRITESLPDLQTGFSLRVADEGDIDRIIALRETLETRYILPREDIEALMKCKWIMDKPTDWWMIQHEGEVAGFGVVYHDGNTLHLLDWAGWPDALSAAAGMWMKHYDASTFTFTAYPTSVMPLSWKQYVHEVRMLAGTVLVINAKRFLERASALLAERVGEEVWSQLQIDADLQHVTFRLGDEEATFAGEELALLLFGQPGKMIITEKLPCHSELFKALITMFPIPLVWYGIGYV